MTYPATQPPAGYGVPVDDLSQPLRGATITQAVTRFFKKYATFTGRASRSEYWWWILVSAIVALVYTMLDYVVSGGFTEAGESLSSPGDVLSYLWALVTFVPGIALTTRRLHDVDKSGWWQLLALIPLVGAVILIVWLATPPKPAAVTRDPGYQPGGYGGYPDAGAYGGGAYGGPASGGYGPSSYGGAPGGPYAGGPNGPYSGGPATGPYAGGPNNDPYGGGPNNGPYTGGPNNDPYGGGPTPR